MMQHPARFLASRRCPEHRHGFTLIELLAVMMIISILAVFLLPRVTEALNRSKQTACASNLREIHKGLLEYEMKFDRLPTGSGVRFFAALFADRVFEQTEVAAKRLTCPGVQVTALGALADVPAVEWYRDLDALDGGASTYAGRDIRNHPIRRTPVSGKEPLVADDNDPEMNHSEATQVLMGDGTVIVHDLRTLQKAGLLGPDEILRVGPDSQIEELRKLSLD
jgi:prepilin-type N-terminal cleavage/methylation domain-containing protein